MKVMKGKDAIRGIAEIRGDVDVLPGISWTTRDLIIDHPSERGWAMKKFTYKIWRHAIMVYI